MSDFVGLGGHSVESHCCHFLPLCLFSASWKCWGIFSTIPWKVGTVPWPPGGQRAFQHLRGPGHAHFLSLATVWYVSSLNVSTRPERKSEVESDLAFKRWGCLSGSVTGSPCDNSLFFAGSPDAHL